VQAFVRTLSRSSALALVLAPVATLVLAGLERTGHT
jgi:hypothetical protein